jgi:hypothetical protein
MLRASAGAGAGGGDGGGDGGGGVGPGGSVWLRTRPELPPAQCVTLAMATLSLHSLATHVHAPHRSSATHNSQQAPADAADGNEYPAVLKQVSASTCGHSAAGVSCSSFAGVATARGAATVASVANPNHATDINTIACGWTKMVGKSNSKIVVAENQNIMGQSVKSSQVIQNSQVTGIRRTRGKNERRIIRRFD